MNVPFTSSGAMSRAQYAFVRKVEIAVSPSEVDQHILSEVEVIRRQFANPGLSLKQCKECLVILLYCAMNMSVTPPGGMDFALPHAVHLAESGVTTQDKRIGYQFCIEMMPENHELRLMLVNTLRKDIESSRVPRICLALETLIHSPFEDVIPAVQSRLYDLVSHNSADVRRHTLAALSSLSRQEPDVLSSAADKVMKRLKDPQPIVISTALTAAAQLREAGHPTSDRLASVVNSLLLPSWDPNLDKTEYWFLLRVLGALQIFGPSEENLRLVMKIIEWAATVNPIPHALLYQCFRILSSKRAEIMTIIRASSQSSPVLPIRSLISSTDPNEQYLVLACLECLDAAVWAGTAPEIAGVLDKWEVERVMGFLESRDGAMRRKTLSILVNVDSNIVEAYFAQLLQNTPDTSFREEVNDATLRALETLDALSRSDGEAYAIRLQNILAAFEGGSESVVLEKVVEKVLSRMHVAEDEFRGACLTSLLDPLSDPAAMIGATSIVILTALIVEYLSIITVPPTQLLQGIARRLFEYPFSVKDACLVTMIRLSAECGEVPDVVIDTVRGVFDQSGRYIRRRCEQFIKLSSQSETIRSALPDFLMSIEANIASPTSSPAKPLSATSRPNSPPTMRDISASKLRYDAYEVPRPHPRLLHSASPQRGSRSITSLEHGRHSPSVLSSPRSDRSALHEDPLSKTVTAGDLALVAGDPDLIPAARVCARVQLQYSRCPNAVFRISETRITSSQLNLSDLIALESPFVSEPADLAASANDPDFETVWNDMEQSNLRGWCEVSIDIVVRRMQGMQLAMRVIAADQAPFEGDLKILISSEASSGRFRGAVLRLRESDDESCLWRLRCDNVELRTRLKRLLAQ
ncbi:ARM repeat-containing protein [Neolentinus lepideus HHB14362 ss-1]|uniref:ARM repeat-containing protein n=1 Tax=Neolentinus lepideus HHB14362 ss-1 TaxID=1314782 RepID=A0A165RJU8_9AGAM|nr:ARM repeat-containing protein [Neolentinus lepideus HHB14362 ss-1]